MRLIGLAVLAAAPLAMAQNAGMTDKDFYEELAQANIAEVELGRLAAQKASSPQVKAFAQQMVTDHTKATTDLQQVAQRKGVTLPTEPGARHKATKQAMESLSGSAFDKAYIQSQDMDHERTIALLEKQMKNSQDSDATALASKMLPVVQQHKKMVDQLEEGGSAAHSGDHSSGSGARQGSGAGMSSPGTGTGSGGGMSSPGTRDGTGGGMSSPGTGTGTGTDSNTGPGSPNSSTGNSTVTPSDGAGTR
jgi:putative membrane protein